MLRSFLLYIKIFIQSSQCKQNVIISAFAAMLRLSAEGYSEKFNLTIRHDTGII